MPASSCEAPKHFSSLCGLADNDHTSLVNFHGQCSEPPLCSYPHCLFFLDLLLDKDFRSSMASNASKVISQTLVFNQTVRSF